ncbi:MAG: thymidine phosphorylase [Candidatus Sumerlaeaceae bacterium]|nr:thymidine phosphorylase [Candidatus Sumerlaeaceae bacterium]
MRAVDIIVKKRNGGTLTAHEIESFISRFLTDEITAYQASALLMAVFFRGMNFDETAALTRAMIASGEQFDWSNLGVGRPVDKHSTGGVGDKVSLILAPLAAACGVAVPMVSGRGLGHTGGTLDKLESIPGFNIDVPRDRFGSQLKELRVVMSGQSDNFVPADKRLYALRDVTGTIESIPLICASILSKKVASGAEALVMDVKAGSGAFMDTVDKARELAAGLIGVGKSLGRPVVALITDMHQPLGRKIGNSLEVIESIDCLRGGGPDDLRALTLELCAEMIVLAKNDSGEAALADARKRATEALDSGAAWEKFFELIAAQGGDTSYVEHPEKLDVSKETVDFGSPEDGYISSMDCRVIGNAAMVLGAGRAKVTDKIDPGVGFEMLVRLGDKVEKGAPLVRIYHRAGHGLEDCKSRLATAFGFSRSAVQSPPLIHCRLT